MSTPDEHWWELRAGEYVLGTLDTKGRELFGRILRHDPELQRNVRAWQARLAPLDAATTPVAPPARLWASIVRRLEAERDGTGDVPAANGAAGREWSGPSRVAHDGPVHVELTRERPTEDAAGGRAADRPTGEGAGAAAARDAVPVHDRPPRASARTPPRGGLFAPFVAAFATAASLVLGVLLYQERERPGTSGESILQADGVSVILGEDGAPLWLVQANFESERVRVTALAAPPADGEGDYQLWQVLPDGGGVAPVALLPRGNGESRDAPVPGLVRAFDAFAVSLEPDGGSPEPTPTGAVLYRGDVVYPDGEEGS